MSQELATVVLSAARKLEHDGRLRSQLRRAASASDVLGLAEASRFDLGLRAALQTINRVLSRNQTLPDECLILIAHRRVSVPKTQDTETHKATPLAVLLGGSQEGDRALSGLRFQRLMNARTGDDRLRQVRRALSLLKQSAHPVAVVEAYLDLHSSAGARRFANLYFTGQTPSAGQSNTSSAQGTTL